MNKYIHAVQINSLLNNILNPFYMSQSEDEEKKIHFLNIISKEE
jgi:hypothetical protein